MQFLAFFFLSCLLIVVGSSQIDLLSSPIDLLHDDSQLFASEPQLNEADSLDQSVGSDMDLFSDNYQLLSSGEPDSSSVFTDVDLSQFAQSDPSLLTAGDFACDSSDTTHPQLFGRNRRRGDLCKNPPVGEAGRYRKDDQLPDLGFTNFATARRTMAVFPRNYEICPYERFSGANIPVCKEANPQDISKIAGVPWYNLRDVVPCTFCLTYFPPPSLTDIVQSVPNLHKLQKFTSTGSNGGALVWKQRQKKCGAVRYFNFAYSTILMSRILPHLILPQVKNGENVDPMDDDLINFFQTVGRQSLCRIFHISISNDDL